MSLSRLLIKDFRNIEHADLALSPGFNFLVGANGSGKTSVLEAIYTLGHGRAFRSLQIGRSDPPRAGCVCSAWPSAGRRAGNRHRPDQRQTGRQQGAYRRHRRPQSGGAGAPDADAADYAGGVYFYSTAAPNTEEHSLTGDAFITKPDSSPPGAIWKRLVKQRNAALRQVSRYAQLRPWDLELIPLAEQISRWRAEYSAAIVEDMADTCQQFLPEFTLTFSFQRGWEKETDYAEVLERNFERDRMLTYTAHGPHKADFRIRADGAPVEDTLSRGQLKLLMCALRLAQGEFLTRVSRAALPVPDR